jgi:hypothetical protein
MLERIIGWILRNATFRIYTSAVPIGRRLGGNNDPLLPDIFVILDIRTGALILVLGYFQTT